MHRDQGYSNVVLDNLLKTGDLGPADRALASRLFYGVIERRLTLDYVLAACSTVPVKKMHPCVTEILRCGIYQLLYMDKIPPSAAVSEAVNLTKALRQPRASGFVNGVLRGVERKKAGLLDGLPDTDEGLEIRYSCPRGLLRLWRGGLRRRDSQGAGVPYQRRARRLSAGQHPENLCRTLLPPGWRRRVFPLSGSRFYRRPSGLTECRS